MTRLRDESGLAMVTAILVTLVVISLSVVSFQLANHDLDSSANERRSVQAIHAAEAGVDRFLEYLANSAPIGAPATSLPAETLNTSPPSTFSVSATYYCTPDGSPPVFSPGVCSTPASALIQSVGTSANRSRRMTAFVGLAATPGASSLSGNAVFANGLATWTGQATITNAAGTDLAANLYSNTNLELKGGGTVYGFVEVQGALTLSGSTDVKSYATSKGQLTISNNSIVRGDARSTTSNVSNGGVVGGNAYYCTGSAPGGTVTGSRIQECPIPPGPPSQTFNTFTYNAPDWQSKGYDTTSTFSNCTTAQAFLAALPVGNYVVRVTSTCQLTIPNMALKGNVAIISNGEIRATGSTAISTVPASPNPPFTLHLMANILSPLACSGGISFAAGTTFPTGVDVLFYTPCHVSFTGNATASIQGQIIAGGDVKFSSGSNITYKPIFVPGINPTGFTESLRYRREISNS